MTSLHTSSPLRVNGPSGSLLMVIGRTAEKRLVHGVDAVEHQRLPVDVVGAAVIAERHLVGGALCHADGRAVERLQVLHAGVLLHHKALAVVEIDRPLPQAKRGAAQERLGRIAIEHVDLARLQRGVAVLCGQRDITDLGWIAEHAGGERAAIIDVEALEVALRVRRRETGKAGAHAAHQGAALPDRVERRRRRCGNTRGVEAQRENNHPPHEYSPLY
jgi:hypothetical protein